MAGPSVSSYGVFKMRQHEQAGPPPASQLVVNGHGVYSYVVQSAPGSLLLASVSAANGTPTFMSDGGEDPLVLESQASFETEAQLDSDVPEGRLDFQFIDKTASILAAGMTLGGKAYPAAPVLKNFAAAQDIDRSSPFTLQWDPPAGLAASDYVIVQVDDGDGNRVAGSPKPWQSGALSGTTTTFTIPAGALPAGPGAEAEIIGIHVTATDTADIPGATGLVGYIASTKVPLTIRGGGGGGGDTTPPFMVFATPLSGSGGVAANVPVTFTFSEAMQPQKAITWTGVANPGSFAYSWSADGKVLTCTYPGGFAVGAGITWQLNAAGFKDVAGNPLLALVPSQLTGTFTVTGGSGGCGNNPQERGDTFLLARFANFLQDSAAAPVPGAPEGDPVAAFFASFAPTALNPTGAELVLPGGQTKALGRVVSTYLFQQIFADETAMNAAFAAGRYLARVATAGGTGSVAVDLGNAPVTPRCANHGAAQAIDAAADFALTWDAFVGAGSNDRIEITIRDGQGAEVFHRPDDCAVPPKPLAATATSATIPADTLRAGRVYEVELNFFKVSGIGTNASPAFSAFGGYSKTTRFHIKTTGGAPDVTPVITSVRVAADLHFEADVTASPGRTLTLEATSDYVVWVPVGNVTVPASGKATLRDSRAATAMFQAYRVRSE